MPHPADMLSPHFLRREMACHCCNRIGGFPVNLNFLLASLEKLRELAGKPILVHCAYRCPKHNAEVGGVENSYHCQDMAADISVPDVGVDALAELAEQAGLTGIGRYRSLRFVHVDIGPKRTWEE